MNTQLHHDDPQRPATQANSKRVTMRHLRAVAIGMLAMCLMATPLHAQDLAMTAVTQPLSGCALSAAESVSVRIINYGPTLPAGTSFLTMYSINSGPAVNEAVVLPNALPTHGVYIHTFAVAADLSVAGSYSILSSLNQIGDINTGNNTIHSHAVHNSAPSAGGLLADTGSGGSGALTLSGHIGEVAQWEESPDAQRWFKLANTTTTQSYSDLGAITHFRARVVNAPCAPALSNVVIVAP